jgi:hypothetical protein
MKVIAGNLQGLKGQTSYDLKFTYDSITVGRNIPEEKYLHDISARWEIKERGKGATFVKMWYDDRQGLYEPAFVESFEKSSKVKLHDQEAKYTLVFKTHWVEGGWDLGIEGSRAIIAGELWIVESGDNNKVKAKISIRDSQGNNSDGGDFDMTKRIKRAYAAAGKWLAIYLDKHAN